MQAANAGMSMIIPIRVKGKIDNSRPLVDGPGCLGLAISVRVPDVSEVIDGPEVVDAGLVE